MALKMKKIIILIAVLMLLTVSAHAQQATPYLAPTVSPIFSGNIVLGTSVPIGTSLLTIGGSIGFQAARTGTFVCTGAGTITITNSNMLATSNVIISMNAQGGAITTPPAMKTVTGGTGFTVFCGATDTSTYNYVILN